MSYGISVSFKNCEEKDVYKHIEDFSHLVKKYKFDIIKENGWFLPFGECDDTYEETKNIFYVKKLIKDWIRDLFNYHIYYSAKIKSLCIVWNNYHTKIDEIKKWFDGYVYFQNSCDQDYDYSEWEFNEQFKQYISDVEFLRDNDRQFKKLYKEITGYKFNECHDSRKVTDYDRRTLVYEMCYKDVDAIWESPIRLNIEDCYDSYYDEVIFGIRILCGLEHIHDDECLKESNKKWRERFNINDEESISNDNR